jgi:hypothetical protein
MLTTKDIFKHAKGNFDRVTNLNYSSWSKDMRHLLRAIDAWDIINGDEVEPPRPGANATDRVVQKFKDYRRRKEDAAASIYNSCTKVIKVHIDNSDDPTERWRILAESLNTASTSVQRLRSMRNQSYATAEALATSARVLL